MGAGVLDSVAGFVSELAEIHLKRVSRLRQHTDIRPGAKHPLMPRGDNHRPHLRLLKPQPLHRIIQLDIHAQVIGILLKFITRMQRRILLHPQGKPRHRPIGRQPPMPVAFRCRRKINPPAAHRRRYPIRQRHNHPSRPMRDCRHYLLSLTIVSNPPVKGELTGRLSAV